MQLTDAAAEPRAGGRAILLAALALPGLGVVQAATPPERAQLSVDYLRYRDSQPGLDRVTVSSPSVGLLLPLAGAWSLEANAVQDVISGATPRYHTAISGASRMDDKRRAGDLHLTRYFERASLGLGLTQSVENDYRSRALALAGTVESEDKNTTWNLGAGVANDRIDPVNRVVRDERRHTVDMLAGVTQVFGVRDIAQATFTHAHGEGYYTDPYKDIDKRPRERTQDALLLRWNHRLAAVTSRLSYRYYRDSFGIRAHTVGEELVLGWGSVAVTPSVRWYTQSAADFYVDPVYDPQFGPPTPPGFDFGNPGFVTQDQRMAAFGALTLGVKLEWQPSRDWRLSASVEQYRERAALRWIGSGSWGLEPFTARWLRVGLARWW
jgi:hypothetical protein